MIEITMENGKTIRIELDAEARLSRWKISQSW